MAKEPPVTLHSIAAECGLSVTAVSKILRGDYKGNTAKGRQRIAQVTAVACRQGYVANGAARRLRSGRHRALAVLMPVSSTGHPEFFSFEYVDGIAAALADVGYTLSLLTYPVDEPEIALKRLSERSVDAAVVLDHSSQALEGFLATASIPAIFLNVEPRRGLPTLCRDERAAARGLTEALIGLGYRRIVLVAGWELPPHFSHHLRAEGVAAAVDAARGVRCETTGVSVWAEGFERSIAACRLDATSVIVAIDAATALRLPRCLDRGQPVACLDQSHVFHVLAPDLSCAAFDRAAIGRKAAERLLRVLGGGTGALRPATVPALPLIRASTPPTGGGTPISASDAS